MVARKYLIAGAVVTVLVIITIVLLAVLLPKSKDDANSSGSSTESPTTSTTDTTEQSTTSSSDSTTPMLDMLDAMQQLLMGSGKYNREYYNKVRACMEDFDPRLVSSQDGAWQGMIDYWNEKGTDDDPWGGRGTQYFEQNETHSDYLNMAIYEPCNYASNEAFYFVVADICNRKYNGSAFSFSDEYVNALGASFAALAYGSSLMHGSHTWIGFLMDNAPISVVSYLVHQATMVPLKDASSILTDLSPTPRNQTALQLAEEFLNMYDTMPVNTWYEHINSLDIPDYYYTFAALTTTALNLAFDQNTTENVVLTLGEAFSVPDELIDFILSDYLPELSDRTQDVDLGPLEQTKIAGNFMSSLIKLIYAFLWQEERMTDNPMFLEPDVNAQGWALLPTVNAFANRLNSFEYSNMDFQDGIDTYPGDVWCNPVYPHAKWHLESAIGLMDLTYTGDEISRLYTKYIS